MGAPGQEHPRTAERRDRVAELTRQGLTAGTIAEILGITKRSVQRHRKERGVTQPPAVHMTAEELLRAKEMLEDGASCREVARTLGRTHGTILKRFPECKWTKSQRLQQATLGRQMSRLISGPGIRRQLGKTHE